MRFLFGLTITIAFLTVTHAQKRLDRALDRFNKNSVPYIQVDELQKRKKPLILDARQKEEYLVSHLKNAIWIGYKDFQSKVATEALDDSDQEVVVYCSIGVRSENIGEKLMQLGFTDVKNLYGGIFEWKNQGYPVYDSDGNETENVHAFNKRWGRLLQKGHKVYDLSEITDKL